jgi:hypothetical protein
VAAGPDTDEKSLNLSSTSPAFKQNTIAVCGCQGIQKPAQEQWVAHSVMGFALYTGVAVIRSKLQRKACRTTRSFKRGCGISVPDDSLHNARYTETSFHGER